MSYFLRRLAATLPVMAVGGRGVITTTGNVAPEAMVELVRAAADGDLARARSIHLRLMPLFDALFCETNPIPVKAAMAMLAGIADEIRLPLTPLTPPHRERLRMVLKEQGLL